MDGDWIGQASVLPEEILSVSRAFPIMQRLSERLLERGVLSGLTIGWHCHLTWLTALAAEAAIKSGAELLFSECDGMTTEVAAVDYMRSIGATVHRGSGSCDAVLSVRPAVLSDTGFVLTSRYLESGGSGIVGACEITTSGITALLERARLSVPVIDISSSRLKSTIENFHGVGRELVSALGLLTQLNWTGRRASVIGYGQVGSGAAEYLRRIGLRVSVVDADPVCRLKAHYDGFDVGSLGDALTHSELLITATGVAGLLGKLEWAQAADGLYVFNIGHWAAEVSPHIVYEMSSSRKQVSDLIEEISLPAVADKPSRKVYLAAGGSPVNVAVCSGGAEPTLIHLATELLAIEYLGARACKPDVLSPGLLALPTTVEREASLLALEALRLHSDS